MKVLKTLLPAAVLAAGLTLTSAASAATLISIGFQAAGVNGGAITTQTTGATFATTGSVAYGAFNVNATSGLLITVPGGGVFDTNSIEQALSAGAIDVFVTVQGLTTPFPGAISAFTENFLTNGWSVTETTYLSMANDIYTGTPLSSATFTGIGTQTDTSLTPTGPGPYSVTTQYHIVANGAGSSNATIDVFAVPEPTTWALMIMGFGGVGALVRRRRQQAVFA